MPMDFYTKAVFTVIAAALVGIAGNMMFRPANAVGSDCGGLTSPCYVTTGSSDYLSVRIR